MKGRAGWRGSYWRARKLETRVGERDPAAAVGPRPREQQFRSRDPAYSRGAGKQSRTCCWELHLYGLAERDFDLALPGGLLGGGDSGGPDGGGDEVPAGCTRPDVLLKVQVAVREETNDE